MPDRRRETLQPIIEENIRPGTRVISDGWAAYNDLHTFGGGGVYVHDVVVNAHNFVAPGDDDIHTQSIESLWKRSKKKLRNGSGTSAQLFPSYIKEAMWRENVPRSEGKEVFACFLRLVASKYVV